MTAALPLAIEPVETADPASQRALAVETIGMTKRFGAFTALDDVSIRIEAGSFHALLGENGAGKSTLVKCMMGFYRQTSGSLLVENKEVEIANPREAHERGLGMVYQHFTLIPSLTAAENLVISRPHVPAVIDWRAERRRIDAFLEGMPFRVPLEVPTAQLAAGQKQKLEIMKQIYLDTRFLILDEPTSVLTPQEAEEVLGLLKAMTERGDITILMISHKFREVTAFADEVSVLRRGKLAGSGKVSDLSRDEMAAMMIGSRTTASAPSRRGDSETSVPILSVSGVTATDQSGKKALDIQDLKVHRREIVGIAGVSGNGQKELAEVLGGQRPHETGEIRVEGKTYAATRAEMRREKVRFIPEEPLRNACAPRMNVAENLAFRVFDANGSAVERPTFLLKARTIRDYARSLVERFQVKTASIESPISTLSGGNVQRAVLARELTGEVELLIVANPCFGLDFSAVSEIRARIVEARNNGAAILLISEDLDEILELSDRILVMSEGRIVYETDAAAADVAMIGSHMAGHH